MRGELEEEKSGGIDKVVDVAEYILELHGPMSTMKLHKLLYYCQVYCLVTQDRPMFDLDFQAWMNGPVIPELFELHRGKFLVRHGELYEALEGTRNGREDD
jgi:uncharacterized phage-associated protein